MPADERRLVERLKRRDEAAFNELVRQNQGPLYRMLVRLLGDAAEAEDVAQEVFISVFKAIESFRGDAALSTWLHRIAANHAHNRRKYLARRGRDAQRPFEELATPIDSGTLGPRPHTPHQIVESLQAEHHVQQALSELDDEQRLLITLRDLEDMSYEDIRQVTGLPIGTVKSKLHRARMALHLRFAALQKGTP
ncbi:MAG: sigma-70 family RNA polymerase sigma factor [Polyangiales bacterium]